MEPCQLKLDPDPLETISSERDRKAKSETVNTHDNETVSKTASEFVVKQPVNQLVKQLVK